MELATLIIAFASMAGTVAAAIVAWSARSDSIRAKADAEAATRVADDALSRSATASEESAAALKRANEIAEASLPKKQVHFKLVHTGRGSMWAFISDGDLTPRNVVVTGAGVAPGFISVSETEPRDLSPGDSIEFAALRAGGVTPRVRIEWDDPVTGEHRENEANII